ncbi:MAG: CoA transferase [Zoogloeaceae bacterium]|jgi:crotonobetainyl-CoA:carnitine CoA-transferase CaiB-like acyl-CoA transferase|nr:CoA transferase [Zoogloeaceae bacterium]
MNKNSLLSGIRVLDLTRVLAGTVAGQTLADLGAHVIKVERPKSGDDSRSWVPPYLNPDARPELRESAYFASVNRGKHSIAVNLATQEGQEIIRRLAKESDVLLENYKPGTLARYGLDDATLRALNPRLVYCSLTGFGQTGPCRDRTGYDSVMQAMGAMMDLTGEAQGAPQKVGLSIIDIMTGLYAVIGILAALEERARSGLGQYIDLALFDTQIAALSTVAVGFLADGVLPRRLGNAHPSVVPSGAFACRDGDLQLLAGNQGQFVKLCAALGIPDLAGDTRFIDMGARARNREILNAILSDILKTRPRAAWVQLLNEAGVPCGPINTVAEALEEPQVAARQMLRAMAHPTVGELRFIANPLKFSRTPIEYEIAPPLLGQHTRYILETLGYGQDDIQTLLAQGIVQDSHIESQL